MARRGLDRTQVVDAASAIADARGLDAVTLAAVAARLGVRSPSLYNHVRGRDALLAALAARGARELAAAIRGAAVGRSGPAALEAAARAHRAYALAHPGRYAATVRAPAPGDEEHAAAAAEAVDAIVGVLRAWELDGDDAIHAVRVVRSALHGFVSIEAGGGFGMPLDVLDSFDRLVQTLTAGLGPARG